MSRWLKICLQQYSSLLFVRTFDENQCHDYERFFLLIVFITSQNKIYLHLTILASHTWCPLQHCVCCLWNNYWNIKMKNKKCHTKSNRKITKTAKNDTQWIPITLLQNVSFDNFISSTRHRFMWAIVITICPSSSSVSQF